MVRPLILPSLATTVLVTATASASDLDTLDLARNAVSVSIPLQWDQDDVPLGSYLFARGGVNLLSDFDIGASTFTVGTNLGLDGTGLPLNPLTPMVDGSINTARCIVDPGYDIELGLGLKVADDITLELATGVQWNPIKRVEGSLDYVTVEPDGMGGVNRISWNSTASGGGGEVWQVPITIALTYDAEILEDLRLTVGGGGGVEWSTMNAGSVQSLQYPGAVYTDPETLQPTLVPLTMDLSGQAIALRYQFMVAVSYEIFPGGFLGGYVRYAATSNLDYGPFGFATSPNNLYRGASNIYVSRLENLSIGATFSITF
jgi:hypothetical protein